jgi:lysophospholipase L1-like esterase
MLRPLIGTALALGLLIDGSAQTTPRPPRASRSTAPHWVVSWTASSHGPYPSGTPSAQPDLSLAFPSPEIGARDQSFRLIVRPSIWGPRLRLRLSNAYGRQPVTFDGVHVGLHATSSAVVSGTNQPVTFSGSRTTTVAAGAVVWSDAVTLPFARSAARAALEGRKLAISFHVVGESGPMTWHAKAMQTSWLTRPGAGAVGGDEREAAFPLSTTSWYFLDAVDMDAPAGAVAVVAFGDSITDGTMSTLNGDDRWPDVLSRRLRAVHGDRVSVVNAGIGGNQVIGPERYDPRAPGSGGPSALDRLDRDLLSLSQVSAVIWLEGVNDFNRGNNAATSAVEAGLRAGVARLRAARPGIRVIGATLTPVLGSANASHGFAEQEEKRRALNAFIRTSGLFDGVADFDAVVTDPASGRMRADFVHNTTIGGEGDRLHPNRLGYLAMGQAIDLAGLVPPAR